MRESKDRQMDWTDGELAKQARSGNEDAFRVLVERHSHAIFRLAFRMTGNEQDAEDLVQETFLRAYKQLHKFDGRSAFGTWLFRIGVNCSLDCIRARKLRRASDESVIPLTARDPSAERLFQSGEISARLNPALAALSDTERTAFLLRHCEGKDISQIADVLGVRTSAAKHSVFRAVQKLRRALQTVRQMEIR